MAVVDYVRVNIATPSRKDRMGLHAVGTSFTHNYVVSTIHFRYSRVVSTVHFRYPRLTAS